MSVDGTFGGQADREILEAARSGDERAWSIIYESLNRPLLRYLRFQRAVDPENLLGEVFFRLARSIHKFRGDLAGLRSYAMTIAINLLRDQARRSAVRPQLILREPSDLESPKLPGRRVGAAAEDEALEAQGFSEYRPLLEQLTPDQRHVLYLRFVEDMSVAETAKALGRTQGAIKQMQHRAIENLRGVMERFTDESNRESTP